MRSTARGSLVRSALVGALLGAGGCAPNLTIATDADIVCTDDGDCPAGGRCVFERCVTAASNAVVYGG